MSDDTSPWMTRDQVAAYLSIHVGTLDTWARRGGGPKYYKKRRLVRYFRPDVDLWMKEDVRLHSADDGFSAAILREAERIVHKRK